MTEIDSVKKEIIQLNLAIKELIQRVQNCTGPIEELNELNCEGRKIILLLRNNVALLKRLVEEEEKPIAKINLMDDLSCTEEELTATIAAFQKANIESLNEIDKSNRKELMVGNESIVRHRKKKEKENLLHMSTDVTEHLLSISRLLADSTQRSADTLNTLVTSSASVSGTREELETTGNVIAQSGKLLTKYGRREQTDKVLVFFAFAFFLACVFYIIQKRLF